MSNLSPVESRWHADERRLNRIAATTVWATIAATAWLFFLRFGTDEESEWLAWAHAAGLFVAPCVAFGTVFGRARLLGAIGLSALLTVSFGLTIAATYVNRLH